MQVWTKVVATVAPPLLALGGCSLAAGSGLTPVESRGVLYDDLTATQEVLGGQWDNHDDPTARGCVIPLWVDGEKYPGLRTGEPPVAINAALDAVHETWSDWNFRVERTLIGDVTELQGRSPFGELLIFRVSSDAMTLQGESECRPDAG